MKKQLHEISGSDAVKIIKGSGTKEPEKRAVLWQCQFCFTYNAIMWSNCLGCSKTKEEAGCKTIFEVE